MAKRWVLDTETKGTGAQMVPADRAHGGVETRGTIVVRDRKPLPEKPVAPRKPPRFKVVDLMTREALAEDASTRDTVDVLKGVRSLVDVNLYVWEPTRDDWRMLTLDEKRTVWNFRDA